MCEQIRTTIKNSTYLDKLGHEFSSQNVNVHSLVQIECHSLVKLCSQNVIHELRVLILVPRTHCLVLEDEVWNGIQ